MSKLRYKSTSEAVTALIVMIVILIFKSVILFWCGYFSGWLAEMFIGERLISAINEIFSTSFSASMLPIIGGGLAWIGSFFHGSGSSNS